MPKNGIFDLYNDEKSEILDVFLDVKVQLFCVC